MASETVQINAILSELERVTARVVIKITLDITANLIQTTPVDTGWARANWVPSVGKMQQTTVGSADAVSAVAQTAGLSSVIGYRRGRVFITNNVPYIEALNAGHSPQQPAGFVERGIQKAVTVDLRGFRV